MRFFARLRPKPAGPKPLTQTEAEAAWRAAAQASPGTPLHCQLGWGQYAACGCGLSARFPFCDGRSHKGQARGPEIWHARQPIDCTFCTCGRGQALPHCDGSQPTCGQSPGS